MYCDSFLRFFNRQAAQHSPFFDKKSQSIEALCPDASAFIYSLNIYKEDFPLLTKLYVYAPYLRFKCLECSLSFLLSLVENLLILLVGKLGHRNSGIAVDYGDYRIYPVQDSIRDKA